RKELRNEKPEPETKEPPRKEPSLVEIILKVLADNGQHFQQLGEGESITVIVTFRGSEPAPAQSLDDNSKDAAAALLGQAVQALGEEQKSGNEPAPASPTSAHDYELLGDLHLKQGKYEEAVKAYQQALKLEPQSKQATVYYRKLAQAYLGLGKDSEARQAIEKGMETGKHGSAEPDKAPKHGEAAGSPLPAKLIISVSKQLLDQAGSGKISMEDFAKGATVEYLTFPAAKE